MVCCWLLGCASLFFVLAVYQLEYVGRLKEMAASTEWTPALEQIGEVHWFYVKTFCGNGFLGFVAVVAGLGAAAGRGGLVRGGRRTRMLRDHRRGTRP